MALGGLLNRALQVGAQRIVTVDQRQVHRHGLLHAAVIEALEESAAVLGLGDAAQGLQCLQKRLGIGADVFVHAHLAVGIDDAEIHPVHV
jgi:hypothetical protein